MKSPRFLVPFVHGMEAQALEQAVQLAKSRNATLVPAALIPVAKNQKAKGPRLEAVQQSKDFLEAMKQKAAKCHVPVEQVEVLTSDVPASVETLATKMECESVLLFMRGKQGVLLDTPEVKSIVETGTHRRYVFHLATKNYINLHVC